MRDLEFVTDWSEETVVLGGSANLQLGAEVLGGLDSLENCALHPEIGQHLVGREVRGDNVIKPVFALQWETQA